MATGNAKPYRDYRSLKEVMPYMAELRPLTFCVNLAASPNPVPFTDLVCLTSPDTTIGELTRFFPHQTIIRNTGNNPVKIVGIYEGRTQDGFYIPTNHLPGVQINWGYNPNEIGLLCPDGTGQLEFFFMAEIIIPKP